MKKGALSRVAESLAFVLTPLLVSPLHPERGSVVAPFLVLGLPLLLVCLAWFCTVAALADAVSGVFRRHPSFVRWQRRVMGGMYVALGVRLAFVQRE